MQGNGGTVRAIVLIGVSGSGKSTVGRRLAPGLGAVFLEGDAFHSSGNIAKMRAGVALTDADRRPWLEKLGRAIAGHLGQGRSVVVACSALKRIYRDGLARAARHPLTFIHLTIDPAVLERRLRARRQHFMPVSLLTSQLATLEPLAEDEHGTDIADIGTFETTVTAIRRWVRAHPGGMWAGRRRKGRLRRPSITDPDPSAPTI